MGMIPLLLVSPVLVAVAYYDLRYMRIPNSLVLMALAIFLLTLPLLPMSEITWRLGAAAAVFAIGFVVFALNLFGGGDIKMLSALMLFIPSQTYPIYGFAFSAAMLLGVFFVLTLRAAPWLQGSDWITIKSPGTFPMGISIALSGLAHPVLVSFVI